MSWHADIAMAYTAMLPGRNSWLTFAVGGFGLGVVLSLLGAGSLLLLRGTAGIGLPPTATPTVTPTPTPSATSTPTATPTPVPSPTDDAAALHSRAERAMYAEFDPQKAVDLLSPRLADLADPADLALAHRLVGEAEAALGHFQLAAGHFEALYAQQPLAEHLYLLALTYDLGGDLDRALARYMELAAWESPDGAEYRAEAEIRVTQIIEVVGTPTPPAPN